ncbi:unnamed protein product [Arabidopsis thaliana]|uniref:Uncharacterized protein n=1 Tax=Arabidopsis thaliana TaxID=3702 RepID=A0A654FXN9_ARATH|nr:unnamed protein product [Arabidopsis thaliana]
MSRTAIEGGGKSFDLSNRFVFSNNRRLRIRSFKEHRGLVLYSPRRKTHIGIGSDYYEEMMQVAWRTSQASAENEEFCLSSIRMQTHVHLSAANQEHLSGSLWHFCDPNPSEQSSHTLLSFTGDYTSLNLNNGSFLGPVGRIQLSVLKASQLPKNCECASNNRSKKVTKTCCLEILLRTINVPETESVETDSLCRISTASCFQGPVGRIQSSVLKASQLPKNGECASNNRSKKVTKTCWLEKSGKISIAEPEMLRTLNLWRQTLSEESQQWKLGLDQWRQTLSEESQQWKLGLDQWRQTL